MSPSSLMNSASRYPLPLKTAFPFSILHYAFTTLNSLASLTSQAAEFQLRLEDSEQSRVETDEKLTKLNVEAEALANQLEDNETRSSVLAKQVSNRKKLQKETNRSTE